MEESQYKIYGHIDDILLIGHGSIGRGMLPLIKRHFTFNNLMIVDPFPLVEPKTEKNIHFHKIELKVSNYIQELDKLFLNSGKIKFCVNLSVNAGSKDLMIYCQERNILYIDTANYPWIQREDEGFFDYLPPYEKGNYIWRHRLRKDMFKLNMKSTAICCCGANPGMVSWFVKQALVNLAKDTAYPLENEPTNKKEWALLMKNLGVKGIHIAERDTQRSNQFRPAKHYWNTWSIDGFIAEGYHSISELSWGTHEKSEPHNSFFFKQDPGNHYLYFKKPGMSILVKSWCPTFGPQMGFLITHYESFSISDYFTLKQGDDVVYRPTCNYAYHPAPDAFASTMELVGSGIQPERKNWKVLQNEIVTGMDELGVLLYGHAKNAYWYGSQLTIEDTRKRVPDQNATALQVTSAVLAGMVWALKNPQAGFVEADDLNYKQCLDVQEYYISPVKGYYTEWTPLHNRKNELTEDNLDLNDPWQFKNVLIHK